MARYNSQYFPLTNATSWQAREVNLYHMHELKYIIVCSMSFMHLYSY